MTHTVLAPTPPAATLRRGGLLFAVVASGGLVALALGWWGVSQLSGSAAGGTIKALSGSTARAYSVQLAKVELPGSYDVIEREHGGS
ncbi:MAG: hypothetical protein JWO12_2953, partial [Frankiales bacterium]|nr:hypothetical protein [Frankiales bacterium]